MRALVKTVIILVGIVVVVHPAAAKTVKLRYVASVYKDAQGEGISHPEGVACGEDFFLVADTGNTMKKIAKKSGKEPVLLTGVEVVPAGVRHIIDLQKQGYAYIRP